MRIDAYTKVVLTIIAASLVWICVAGMLFAPAAAQSQQPPQEVVVVGVRSPVAVVTPPRTALSVVYGSDVPVVVRPGVEWYAKPVPARVAASEPFPARLIGVEREKGERWDAIDVNVKEQPRKAGPGH